MAIIAAGTASWNDQGLIDSGFFYPHDLVSPMGRLAYYAERFPLTELEGAFHQLPTVRSTLRIAEQTPPAFTFYVKAYRLLTDHLTGLGALPADIRQALGALERDQIRYSDLPAELRKEVWDRFFLGIEPLRRAGKLGAIILHFPISFVPTPENFDRLAALAEKLKAYRVAVEFEHRAWSQSDHRDEIWDFERNHGLVHLIPDEPDRVSSSESSRWGATNPELAIVRAYGPNRVARETRRLLASGPTTEFAYSEDELKLLAQRTSRLAEQVQNVHVLFSNSHADCAQRNAAQFRLILDWLGGG